MFRYHFLSHFFAELNEICCGSLLNSILKRTEGNFFKHSDFFYSTKSEMLSNFCCVFHTNND